jgi:hypothetical protein
MQEFFEALNGPYGGNVALIAVFTVVGLCSAAIVAFVQWRKIEQHRLEAILKQKMIERGMTADEIVDVIQATQSREKKATAVCRH